MLSSWLSSIKCGQIIVLEAVALVFTWPIEVQYIQVLKCLHPLCSFSCFIEKCIPSTNINTVIHTISLPYVKLLLPETVCYSQPLYSSSPAFWESVNRLINSTEAPSAKQPAVPAEWGENVCDCSLNIEFIAPSLGWQRIGSPTSRGVN